jgi:peptide/nickel transport system permease protein
MTQFLLRRLLAMVPTLLIASLIVFSIVRLSPGTVIDQVLAQADAASDQDRQRLEAMLGLDQPLIEQYYRWMIGVFQGDLGRSLWTNASVSEQVLERLPITLELGFLALFVSVSIAIPIGVYSAIRQNSAGDYIARSFSMIMLSIPSFWLGTLVMIFPSVWWRWSPELEFTSFFEDPLRNLAQMLPPAIILGLSLSAVTMRMTRTMMLEVLQHDFIRTARAKGLSETSIIYRHALPNCLIPIITLVGLQAPILIGGAVILEQIFVIPGMGLLLLEAVSARDYPVISGIFLFTGFSVLLINLIVDLSYAILDPRMRQQ